MRGCGRWLQAGSATRQRRPSPGGQADPRRTASARPASFPHDRSSPDWLHHLADEADAAYLYRELARAEPDASRADLYRRLAEVEDRHVDMWRELMARQGHAVQVPPPSRGARLRAWLARRVGTSVLLPMLLAEEGREVKGYLQLHDATPDGPVAPTALRLAQESKEHARRWRASAAGRASPGTGPARAASSATSSTASTTGSPPTSASWRG